MRFSVKQKTKILFVLLGTIFFGMNAWAQNDETTANAIKIAKPEIIDGGTLPEVGLWGISQELKGFENLPSNLWVNSDASRLENIFKNLKDNQNFIPLNSLMRRVLISGGIAPNDNKSLALLRLKTAQRLGPISSAKMLEQYAANNSETDLAIIAADSLLYSLKTEEACNIISQLKPSKPNKELLELRAGCYTLNNEISAAQLAIDLAISSDTPSEYDIYLSRLISYLSVKSAAPPIDLPFNATKGLSFALCVKAKLPLQAKQIKTLSTTAISAIINQNIALPDDVKNEILLQAAINAAIAPKKYAELSNDIASKNIIKNQTIDETETPKETIIYARIFGQILRNAKSIKEFYALSQRLAPKISSLENIAPIDAFVFTNAAIIMNDEKAAQRFFKRIEKPKPFQSLAMAIIAKNPNSKAIKNRLDGAGDNKNALSIAYGDALIAIAAGLKQDNYDLLIADKLNPLSNNQPNNIENCLFALELAKDNAAIGETALLAYYCLQEKDPSKINAMIMAKIIYSLQKVGLKNEAKNLAIFAIFAKNIEYSNNIKPITPKSEIANPQKSQPKWGANID